MVRSQASRIKRTGEKKVVYRCKVCNGSLVTYDGRIERRPNGRPPHRETLANGMVVAA